MGFPDDTALIWVGELREENLDYAFHMLGVWKTISGRLYYSEDSG